MGSSATGIPPRLMKPFYEGLKGSNPKEERLWTPEMDAAWKEILQTCTSNVLARWKPDLPLEGAVTRCEEGTAVILGHALSSKPRPLWWVFSIQPVRAFTPWLEQLALMLRKIRLAAVRALGRELDLIYLPSAFKATQPLPEEILIAL